uniref:Uncharacterized protein n=1 Tax=Virus NIOZ-UU157 TaxID=2763269 RepID=A0A7S9STJ4_9VIRU|nr:MAG: hypothetical protein NIOZUU157_00156 [Virus NIOZ-UU157]
MAQYFNITGALTQELIAAGDRVNVRSISLANIHSTDHVIVDVYIEKKLTGKFYLIKNYTLLYGSALVLDHNTVSSFSSAIGQFGLYIKLNASDSAVDIIIN